MCVSVRPVTVFSCVVGSKVRNTDFLFGVIVYTGKDTRLNCNTLGPRPRRSVIDKDINRYILMLMALIFILVMVRRSDRFYLSSRLLICFNGPFVSRFVFLCIMK